MAVALIDGDMVAYMAATLAQEDGFPPLEGQDPSDCKPTADRKKAFRIAREILDKWEHVAGCKDRRIALTDRSMPRASFRYLVHPHYKNQRTGEKPMLLEEVEDYLRRKHGAVSESRLEGDDLLGIWQTETKNDDVIVSKDKDMLTIPGRVLVVPHMKKLTPDCIVHVTKKQALDTLFKQVITGDNIDNYKGAPGIGAKGSETWLQAYKEDGLTRWEGLVQAYQWAWEMRPRWHHTWVYPGEPEKEALLNMRCARLLTFGDLKDGKVKLWGPNGAHEWLDL